MPSRTLLLVVVATVVLAGAVPVQAAFVDGGAVSTLSSPDTRVDTRASVANESMTVRVLSGPRIDWDALDTKGAIRTAMASGRLNRMDAVAVGDPLVLAIEHATLSESLADGNATDEFFARVSGNHTSLRIEQTNPTPERHPKHVLLARNATTVVADPANDTTFVVVDTGRSPVYFGDPSRSDHAERTELRQEDHFVANLTLGPGSNLTTANRTVATEAEFSIRVREARLSVDDDLAERIYVDPAPDQRIAGSTNVRAGRNVTVVVRWGGPNATEDAIRRTVPVRAGEDGENRFSAAFDFGDVAENATASVDALFDGRSLVHSPANLVVVTLEASVHVRAVRPDAAGPYARVETDANLSRGGFVALHRDNATGQVVGISRYLGVGRHRNVSVYAGYPVAESGRLVAVAHRDPNHNHWFDGASDAPYATSGGATAATDYVLTPQEAVQATPTTLPSASSTPPSPPSATTTRPTTSTDAPGESPETSQPGFGILEGAVSLLTLLAGIALRRGRRSN